MGNLLLDLWNTDRKAVLFVTHDLEEAIALADIFLGRITHWNDPRIAALNPGVDPARDRHHRGAPLGRLGHDASSSPITSPRCRPSGRRRSGSATSVEWPVGLGGKGNEGVTQQVKQTEGAIGYVELIYAISNGLPATPRCKNAAGQFVEPTLKGVTRGGERRRLRRRRPTSGCPSPTPRAPTRTRSRRSPGCWSSNPGHDVGEAARDPRRSCSGCWSPRPSGWRRISTTPRSRCRSSSLLQKPARGLVTDPLQSRDGPPGRFG